MLNTTERAQDPVSRTVSCYRKRGLMVAAAMCVLAVSASLSTPAATSPATPKLNGMWLLTPSDFQRNEVPPLTPAAKAASDATRKAVENGGAVLSENGKKCLPIGMPRLVTNE